MQEQIIPIAHAQIRMQKRMRGQLRTVHALRFFFCETVMPWRLGSHVPKAKHVLELPVHTDFDVRPGDQLLIEGPICDRLTTEPTDL